MKMIFDMLSSCLILTPLSVDHYLRTMKVPSPTYLSPVTIDGEESQLLGFCMYKPLDPIVILTYLRSPRIQIIDTRTNR